MNTKNTCCICGIESTYRASRIKEKGRVFFFCQKHCDICQAIWDMIPVEKKYLDPDVQDAWGMAASVLVWLSKHPEWLALL